MEARRQTILRARGLRRRMTFPEVLLWQSLRKHAQGLKFRRQHPIGPFVLDFYCEEARLAVEVDGAMHNHPDTADYDERRDAWLRRHDVEVLRLPARLVFRDMEATLEAIVRAAEGRQSRTPA